MELDYTRAHVPVGPRVVCREPGGYRVHLRLRRRERDLRPDSRDHVPPPAAADEGLVLRDRLRHVDVALPAAPLETELEVRRQYADHRVRLPVQRQRPAEDSGVTAEAACPESVRQDDDSAARPELLGKERPTVGGADAQRVEEPFRDQRRVEHLGRAVAREVERERLDRRHLLETRRLLAPVQEVRRRRFRRTVAVVRIRLPQRHQTVRFRKRRRLQQHGVDDGEDGRGRADRKRQGQDRGRRETGLPAQQPQPEAYVLDDLLQCGAGGRHLLAGLQRPLTHVRRLGHRMLLSVTGVRYHASPR